ncbi:MAG: hypothetical protein ACE5DX_06010 [Candidatus Dojkabacteria bacterium]
MEQLQIVETIDANLREGIGLIWNRRSKLQGFNLAVTEPILTTTDRSRMSDLSYRLDLANKQKLKARDEPIPLLRLNRLDFFKTEDGGISLIEQNPGWVDNIGMACILSEDFAFMERMRDRVLAAGCDRLLLLYTVATKAGRYEQDLTADLFSRLGLPAISGRVDETNVEPSDAVLLSAPESKLSMDEFFRVEQIRSRATLTSPTRGETALEDKTLLNNYGIGIPSIPVTNMTDFQKLSEEGGFTVVKSTTSESGGGIAFLTGSETKAEQKRLFENLSNASGVVLLQEPIGPYRVGYGIGLDFIGEQGNRPKGKPLQPLTVELAGRAVKFNAWTVNGKVCAVIGTVARDMSTYINDAGFNFNASSIR